MTELRSIHHDGYEGTVEEAVPVQEFHQARCTLCDWVGEEHDGLDWKSAEEEAVEHFQDFHAVNDEDDEDDDEDEETSLHLP